MDIQPTNSQGACAAMITRRHFIVSSAGAAAIASAPMSARALSRGLIVVTPSILASPPPPGALTSTGHDLLREILPRINAMKGLEGVVREADAQMLAELVRFHPRLRWKATVLAPGDMTRFGPLHQQAQYIRVICR